MKSTDTMIQGKMAVVVSPDVELANGSKILLDKRVGTKLFPNRRFVKLGLAVFLIIF